MRSKCFYFITVLFFFIAACNSHNEEVKNHVTNPNSIEAIKDAINEHPDSVMLKVNLIESYRNEGYYDSAIDIANEEAETIGVKYLQLIEKKEATNLFGNQKDESFSGLLKAVTQTFDRIYLYPTIEEQAANLLYFVIKNLLNNTL